MTFCGLIEYTGFTFTQRKGIGRMTTKWNTVLANGRLAMMAIIRMFFQGGHTGFFATERQSGHAVVPKAVPECSGPTATSSRPRTRKADMNPQAMGFMRS